ncbi:CMP-N-acetylneuraminate-poly-alpha-2,8-sialyltransferase-like [Glandiceps talaboti]
MRLDRLFRRLIYFLVGLALLTFFIKGWSVLYPKPLDLRSLEVIANARIPCSLCTPSPGNVTGGKNVTNDKKENLQEKNLEVRSRTKTTQQVHWQPRVDVSVDEATKDINISCIFETLSKPWKQNATNYQRIRDTLDAMTNTREMMLLTKANCKLDEEMTYSLQSNVHYPITEEILSALPNKAPLASKKFKVCSIVGGSGILIDSNCGKEIDKSDFVIRCNMPPVEPHAKDAGQKSDITSANNVAVLGSRYRGLARKYDQQRLISDVLQYQGYLWVPLFTVKSGTMYALRAYRTLKKESQNQIQMVFPHPKHQIDVQGFWEKLGIEHRATTGAYMTAVAISLCDEVHLYGFWPFATTIDGQRVDFHYYDDLKIETVAHDLFKEFSTLVKLHEQGVINIHAQACT